MPAAPGVAVNQMGEELSPQGLEAVVREAARVAGTPVIVTENGLATQDDTQHRAFLEQALAGVARCLADGIDVRGYFCWSALDSFEWIFGYGPKFGIVAVDRATQERTVTPSGTWFGHLARTNGASIVP